MCMNIFVPETIDSSGNKSAIEVPPVLRLINRGIFNVYRQTLCELSYHSLEHEPTRMPMTEAIYNWIYWLNNTKYEANVLTYIQDITTFSRNHKQGVSQRLKLYLRDWGRKIPLAQKAFNLLDNTQMQLKA